MQIIVCIALFLFCEIQTKKTNPAFLFRNAGFAMTRAPVSIILHFSLIQFFKTGIKFVVSATYGKKVIMCSALDYFTTFKHHYGI